MPRIPSKTQNKLNAARRREVVEATIREKGWSEKIVAELIVKTGANRSTIYRDKEATAKLLADEESAGLEQRRALFLGDLRRVASEAKDAGQFSPVTRLLDMESRILGLDRVPLPNVEEDTGPIDTSLEAVLTEVRKMRKQAQAGHSYVAADKLLEREHAIVESIRQRDEAQAASDMSHLDEDAKVALCVEVLRSLPDTLRAKVLSAL